ncbi:molybdate ABC transporter substrate-binding protein [Magnetovibrio sp.]|uniref:molybdate ABC transporter substrate-binding protein n=1 Tax=Magnetovibrio sp. TaxID=2024836 RepID=UPI002F95BFA8
MKLRRLSALIIVGLGLALASGSLAQERAQKTVTVFAAASTQPALNALVPVLERRGITLKAVHGGSSALARQIEHGAPADIFLSANVRWMDYLTDLGLIIYDSKRTVATNQLVLIAGPKSFTAPKLAFGPGYPLDAVLQGERLAIADPDHVPAGIYGREALGTLRMWTKVQSNLARTSDVTSALMLVARGEARLGVVYASDVKRSDRVSQFAAFPPSSHSPITYPAAIVRGQDRDAVRTVMNLFISPEGQAAFKAAGFEGAP